MLTRFTVLLSIQSPACLPVRAKTSRSSCGTAIQASSSVRLKVTLARSIVLLSLPGIGCLPRSQVTQPFGFGQPTEIAALESFLNPIQTTGLPDSPFIPSCRYLPQWDQIP